MSFAAPVWLSLLGLLPFVILLHLRRERRAEVGSLVVWLRVVGDQHAPRPRWSRLLGSLPLVLQLVAVTASALALAGPRFGHAAAGHQIYLIDASATMLVGAREGARLERAQEWLRQRIGALEPEATVSVVVVEPRPRAVLVRGTAAAASSAVLPPLGGVAAEADWPVAARLARAIAGSGESVAVTLLTDEYGAGPAWEATAPLFGDERLSIVSFGGEVPNAGLADLAVAPGTSDDAGIEITVRGAVVSHRLEDVPLRLNFAHRPEGSTEFNSLGALDVRAGDDALTRFERAFVLPGAGDLRLALGGADAYPHDDSVTLPIAAATGPRKVLMVGEIEAELVRALELLDHVELFHSRTLPEVTAEFDLVIVDGVTPERKADTAVIWLGVAAPGVSASGTLAAPRVTDTRTDHRLARVIDLAALEVRESLVLPVLEGASVLVEAAGLPLLQLRTTDTGRQALFGFRLSHSNLPEQIAFPAFVAELFDWVVARPAGASPRICVAGRACPLPAVALGGGWQVVDAEGEVVAADWGAVAVAEEAADLVWLPEALERAFVPRLPGAYRLDTGAGSYRLAVTAQPWPVAGGAAGTSAAGVQTGAGERALAQARPLAPWRLAVIGMLAAIMGDALMGGARLRARSRRRRLLARVALTAALLLGAAALLRLPLLGPAERTGGVALVDLRPLEGAEEARARLVGEGAGGGTLAEVHLVGTGPGLQVEPVGQRLPPEREPPAGESRTGEPVRVPHFPTALDIARGAAAAAGAQRVTIVGSEALSLAAGTLAEQARAFLAAGMAVDALGEIGHPPGRLRFGRVFVPQGVRAGDTIMVRAVIDSPTDLEVIVRAEVDDRRVEERPLSLAPGANVFEFPLRVAEAGLTNVELSLAPGVPADQPTSATASVIIDVGPAPVALLISAGGNGAALLKTTLERQGVIVDVQPPLNLPWSLEGLARYDVVLLSNVPALEIHSTQQGLLERWVRGGGGLLVLGGENSFGPGGYFRTVLEELSPLSSQVPQDAPEVTMLFVLDRSGSMQQRVGDLTRMDVAKEAALGAIDLLAPGSQVGVIAYDTEASVPVPLQSVGNRELIDAEIGGLRANGGTALHPALLEARRLLADVDSAAIHIVILTDGMSQPGDFATVLADLRSLGATISLVGIGEGADRVQLNELARLAGGGLHMTNDVKALPSILAQEALVLAGELTREEVAEVRFTGVAAPFLGPAPRLPPLQGYVVTRPKPRADVHAWVEADEEIALLATWRYGLGHVMAFASHGAGAWTSAWVASPEFSSFWDQAARWAVGTAVEPGLTLALEPGPLHVSVRALLATAEGAPLTGERLSAWVAGSGPDAGSGEDGSAPGGALRLEEVAPGIYEGRLDLATSGLTWVRVAVDGDPTTRAVAAAHVSSPIGAGAGGTPSTAIVTPSLAALARITGGSLAGDPGARPSAGSPFVWQPRFRAWLVAAVMVWLVALVARYGVPQAADVRAQAARVWAGRYRRHGSD